MTDKERIERLEANQEVILKAVRKMAKKIDKEKRRKRDQLAAYRQAIT